MDTRSEPTPTSARRRTRRSRWRDRFSGASQARLKCDRQLDLRRGDNERAGTGLQLLPGDASNSAYRRARSTFTADHLGLPRKRWRRLMRGLQLLVDWCEPPDEGEAFGPERCTWGNLTLIVDGQCITSNHLANCRVTEDLDFVTGGMSNLAEWLVENWIHLLWEVHTPYARAQSQPERGRRQNIPGLRQAFQGWFDYVPADTDRRQIAAWQHRHSLGHATSDIAIPSIVIVPEDRHVLISVDHPPTHQIDSTVRFTPPGAPDSWPSEHVWVAKEDFVASMSAFIDATLERAKQFAEIREWTDWLNEQWEASKAAVKDVDVRLRLMFGDLVASSSLATSKRICSGVHSSRFRCHQKFGSWRCV